jgi:RNA-binding motif X-linked protein 2
VRRDAPCSRLLVVQDLLCLFKTHVLHVSGSFSAGVPRPCQAELHKVAELSYAGTPASRARTALPLSTPAMNSVRAIQQLNKRELEAGITSEGSWHTDYRDTAFVYIGGLPFELSEGDIITICSQYGEPVWIKLARDKETGKSRGFAWIKYEDQRSCDLAVDNLGGSTIMDRVIRVDHARYKPRDDEDMRDNTMGELDIDPATDSDGARRKRQKTNSESNSDDDRPLLPEEIELGRLMEKLEEDDPMRDSMIKTQQEKVDEALEKLKKAKRKEKDKERRREKHRHRNRSKDRHRDKSRKTIKEEDEDDHYERHARRKDNRSQSRDKHSDGDRPHRKAGHRRMPEDTDHRHRCNGSIERRHGNRVTNDTNQRGDLTSKESKETSRSERSPLPYRARSPQSDHVR